ncbi:MAG: sensor domain-containing phosphodiesterase [Acidimicrobiales bacterium]|nr:sensor domain-containing phosphodiesterase [Acidimicrobiales bacterium]RZV46244.1 MAG: EAL domain-containing protein [Acidimicrobiales bacterium]
MRLSVGRRLALVVLLTLVALGLAVLVSFRQVRATAIDHMIEDLHASTATLSHSINEELSEAMEALERAAASDDTLDEIIVHLGNHGFVTAELVESVEESRQSGVTSNFFQRASSSIAVGGTQVVSDQSSILIGTPSLNADSTGSVLIGAYDTSGIAALLAASGFRETGESLLAARASNGQMVIFTPSKHQNSSPPFVLDDAGTELLNAVLTKGVLHDERSIDFLGRNSVLTMNPLELEQWVLIASIDVSEAAGSTGAPWWLVPMFLGVAVLAILPVFDLRRRLRDVTRGAEQLIVGPLSHRLQDTSGDEIGLISRALQSLDDRLQADQEAKGRSAALMQHRAMHDPLTGLANRARLMEELSVALNTRSPLALIFCDIDDFKGINDTQGHAGGDIVLKHVANQLGSACGGDELIARFGGDEFCVLSRTEPAEARVLASSVERALDSNCLVNGSQQRVGGSVGLAIAKVTDTPDTLLKSADLAMYREKERRRGLRRAQRSTDVADIKPEQIRLLFQPVVEMAEERIVGVEVLARYMHPELGMLDPSSFLPPGSALGEFDRFDLEILTRSIAQLGDWLSAGVVDETFTMSMNLAPDHVSDSDSTRQIFEIVRQNRVPPSMLQIEVTEQQLFAHQDDLIRSLDSLREAGLKVAIDDFGIEGSNVDRLMQIPSDVVKIDRSFVSEIDREERAVARLRAILDIVRTEGRVAIAEGVERRAQATILRDMGVTYGQGYLWHAPIAALALSPLLGRASRWNRKKPIPNAR